MAKRHQKASCSCSNVFENAQPNNQTTKHVCLQLQDDRGLEAIVSDLELTDDHEEATEAHAAQVARFRVRNPLFTEGSHTVKIQVRCGRHIMCPRTLLSRRCSSQCSNHIMWLACTVVDKKMLFKSDKVPVAMTKAPSRGTRVQKTPAQIQHNCLRTTIWRAQAHSHQETNSEGRFEIISSTLFHGHNTISSNRTEDPAISKRFSVTTSIRPKPNTGLPEQRIKP